MTRLTERNRVIVLALLRVLSDYQTVLALRFLLSQEETRIIAHKLFAGDFQELQLEEFDSILDDPEAHADLGASFLSIGERLGEASCLRLAVEFFERSREEGFQQGTPDWALSLINQGNTQQLLAERGVEPKSNLNEAIELYTRSRAEGFQKDTPSWASSLMNQGNAYTVLAERGVEPNSNLNEAMEFYERSRAEGFQKDTPNWAGSLTNQGALHYELNQLNQAHQRLKKAIEIIETLRTGMMLPESRRGYTETVTTTYTTMTLTCLKLGNHEEAFSYAEAAKSRTFNEQLASEKKTLKAHPELLDEREKLQEQIRQLEVAMNTPIDPGLPIYTQNQIKARKKRAKMIRETLIDEYDGLMLRIKEADPEYYNITTAEPISIKELQTLLGETTLVEYFIARDEVWAFTVNKELSAKRLDTTAIRLAEEVIEIRGTLRHYANLSKRLGRSLEDGDTASASKYREEMRDTEDECNRILGRLYDTLVTPLDGLSERLLIVPHGVLHYLPFLALKGDRYLVEEHLVGFAQSATSLRYGEESAKVRGIINALVVGNPTRDLAYSEKEALEIAEMFDADSLLGGMATVEAVSGSTGGRDLLHFSCHGDYDWVKPGFSGLVLSDGMLKAVDFMDMELGAELIVLSACETGLGDLNRGDEVEGLVRAVQYAGVGDVVASLWSVFDESTLMLFRRFYDEWRREGDAVSSLCKAARSMIMDPDYSVYHWAPFQTYTNKHQQTTN